MYERGVVQCASAGPWKDKEWVDGWMDGWMDFRWMAHHSCSTDTHRARSLPVPRGRMAMRGGEWRQSIDSTTSKTREAVPSPPHTCVKGEEERRGHSIDRSHARDLDEYTPGACVEGKGGSGGRSIKRPPRACSDSQDTKRRATT